MGRKRKPMNLSSRRRQAFHILLFEVMAMACVHTPIYLFLPAVFFERVASQSCGEEVQGLEGSLSHVEYPDDYSSDANCQWSLTARDRDEVFIEFELLDVESDRNGGCTYDYVR